jgi:hypothetical protein
MRDVSIPIWYMMLTELRFEKIMFFVGKKKTSTILLVNASDEAVVHRVPYCSAAIVLAVQVAMHMYAANLL